MADAVDIADVAERGDAHEAAVGDNTVAMRLETTRPARAAPGMYQMTWVAHSLATCPCCGGTDLFQAGGDNKKVWYYYRCKRCDPTKSGRPFKAPRPPPKIGPAAARAAAAQLPAADTARPHLGVGHGGRNACLRGMCADPTVLAAATALRAALAGVDDARRAESDVAMAGRSSRAAAEAG